MLLLGAVLGAAVLVGLLVLVYVAAPLWLSVRERRRVAFEVQAAELQLRRVAYGAMQQLLDAARQPPR